MRRAIDSEKQQYFQVAKTLFAILGGLRTQGMQALVPAPLHVGACLLASLGFHFFTWEVRKLNYISGPQLEVTLLLKGRWAMSGDNLGCHSRGLGAGGV